MCCPRRLIVMGVSSDSGRNPIGWRTQSDRVADGIRLGGGRNPIGWRTQSDWVAGAFKGVHLSQVHQQSKQELHQQNKRSINIARLVHLRQVHPLKKTLSNRNNIAAGHAVMSNGYTLLYIRSSRGCTCLKCTNKTRGTSILLCWCT